MSREEDPTPPYCAAPHARAGQCENEATHGGAPCSGRCAMAGGWPDAVYVGIRGKGTLAASRTIVSADGGCQRYVPEHHLRQAEAAAEELRQQLPISKQASAAAVAALRVTLLEAVDAGLRIDPQELLNVIDKVKST